MALRSAFEAAGISLLRGGVVVAPVVPLKEIDYLRQLCEYLQELRDCALAVNDHMRKSEAGDCFTYEGGMNAVEMFRDKEAEIVSFKFQHGDDGDD